MSLDKYMYWASAIAEELGESLSSEDADALKDDLRAMGERAWEAWAAENHKAVSSFLTSTNAQRAKRKAWADPILRRRLSLAAHHEARLAAAVLSAAEQLAPGPSYRDMAGYAASFAQRILLRAIWVWPFDSEPPWPHWLPVEDWDLVDS